MHDWSDIAQDTTLTVLPKELTPGTAMTERGPTLVVAACIVQGENALLARRYQPSLPSAHLKWELPGGKVKIGETPQEALRREIKEELGLRISVLRLLPHVQTNYYQRPDGTTSQFVIIAFECVPSWGPVRLELDESAVDRHRWVLRGEQSKLELLPGTAEFLNSLDEIDQDLVGDTRVYIGLERRRQGALTDYWELITTYDLFGYLDLQERHVNLQTRTTHNKFFHNIPKSAVAQIIRSRIRALARHDYFVSNSTFPALH